MNEIEVVNAKTGELTTEVPATPQELLMAARDAARALKAVIDSNDRPPVSFNGKQYLEYQHWQTLAKFYHCSVGTEDAKAVEIDGVKGFHAKAKVIDEKTGLVIGSAEAYCLRDEANWKSKPIFQLASMAQTRAGAKALANKFRYVAIVAGYEPTPKEELTGDEFKPNVQMPKEKTIGPEIEIASATEASQIDFGDPPTEAQVEEKVISEKQRKLLFAKWKSKGVHEDVVKAKMAIDFGKRHSKDLTTKELDKLLKWIDTLKPSPE